MKKILIGLGALVVVLIAAALVVPALIPVDTYKGQLLAQIEEATGRKARIDGEFGFSILPSLEFTAGKVALANAQGAQPADMVALDRLNVRIGLLPLIGGNVVIDSFVLEKPVISLSVDRNGRPNWQFDTKQAAPKPGEAATPAGGAGDGPGLSGLTLGDVRIVDAKLSYSDARSGDKQEIDAINMKVSLPSLSSPMKAEGSLVWNKEKVTLAMDIANPNAFLDAKATDIAASVSSSPVKLSFKGNAQNDKVMKAKGAVDLDVPSVRKLADWAGSPLDAPGKGFGPLKIAGNVDLDGQKIAFREARLAFDEIKGTGDFRFDGSGQRPYANAKLALETLDLNPYMPPEGAKPAAPAQPAPAQGGAASEGWSDDPIDFSGLRAADADLDLTVGGLLAKKIKVGKSHIGVALKNGRLVADLTEMALYGGNGKAKIVANAAERVPAIGLSFDLWGLQANPFLSDAIDLDRLEGTANAAIDVQGRGASQRQIVSSLDGAGKVQFLDGAVRGINLAAMVRNIQGAFLDPEARKQQKTDFAELGGTYTIKSGILTNQDLELKSPLLRVAGRGTVNLPQRTVNYRVEPKAVASTSGQGGASDVSGIMVPVIVEGPWDNLSYKPDLAGAIGGVARERALEQLQRVVPGGATGTGSGTPSSPAPSLPVNPGDTLRRMLGR